MTHGDSFRRKSPKRARGGGFSGNGVITSPSVTRARDGRPGFSTGTPRLRAPNHLHAPSKLRVETPVSRLPPRACASPGCARTATRGPRCPACDARRPRAPRTGPSRSFRNTTEEQALRGRVLREEPTCAWCGVDLSALPPRLRVVDHIVPLSEGGPTSRENLRSACKRCHDRRTRTDQNRRRRERRGESGSPLARHTPAQDGQ